MVVSDAAVFVLIGLGLLYLAVLIAVVVLGIRLILRRPGFRWLGGLLVFAFAAWSFGPWLIGEARVAQAAARSEALQRSPRDLPLAGARVVMLVYESDVTCDGLCLDLLESGLVEAVHLLAFDGSLDGDRLARDPMSTLLANQVALWRATLGPPDEGYGGLRFPELLQVGAQGRPEADLVILEDWGGLLTREAWDVLMPGLTDPVAEWSGLRYHEITHVWQGWPTSGTTQEAAGRVVWVDADVPQPIIGGLGFATSTVPGPPPHLILWDWLCHAGDERSEFCETPI